MSKQMRYNKRRRRYSIGIIMLLIMAYVLALYPLNVYAAQGERETIKVGFFAFEGYHMMDADGNRSGYGYDFLRMAARYLDVNYEYIGYDKSWDEIQDMLENGEIDLLTSAQKTPEREKIFDFSKPIGTSSAMLTVKSDNASIIEQEYDTYQNIKVGVLHENSRNQDFIDLANEKGFSYKEIYFDKESQIKEALQKGTIDAALTSSLRSIHDERVLEKFDTRDFYVMVKKGNNSLLDKINYAIDQMNLSEGDWKDSLSYQYYGSTESKTLVFSEREQEIINEYASGKKKLTVTCSTDRGSYSYEENGKLKGIIPDMFAQLMDYAGIPYEVVIPKDRKEYEQWQKDGSVDIFMDVRISTETDAEDADMAVTVPYMNLGIAMITRRDFNGTIEKLAISEYQGLNGIEDNLAKDAKRITYKSRDEAMKAVRDGKADATFVYLYTAQKFVNMDSSGRVMYIALEQPTYPHCIGIMSRVSHEMSGILTKCIYAFPENKMDSLISEYTSYKVGNITLTTLIMLHPIKSIIMLVLVVGLILALVFVTTRLKEKQHLLAMEKRYAQEKEVLAKLAKTANESKSRFLFNMSHDIRTPLNAVLGFTNLAREAVGNKEKELDYLDKIQISGEHLLEIVNDVLEMSRVETGTIKLEETECHIIDTVNEVALMISGASQKKNQKFTVDTLGMEYPYVVCDRLRIKEILANLLENAVKFTPVGGWITLTMKQQLDAQGEWVDLEIRVKDNGCGMTSSFADKLFEPFEKEKSTTVSGLHGTGLGLAITKRYVDAMGGQISVQSAVDEGTEFVVNLRQKLAQEPVSIEKEIITEDEKTTFYGKRILIVEDNELNREIEVAILEDAGFLVEEAVNGKEAVDKVKDSQEGYYDGILMDIQMPVMDGYEATREIRKLKNPSLADTLIIAVSANAFDEDKLASEKAGMNAHIEKPIQLDYLFDTLEDLLSK